MKRRIAAGLAAAIGLACAGAAWSQPPAPTVDYVLKDGDTLGGISRAYLMGFGDHAALAKLNGVKRTRRMRTGSTVRLPVDRLRTEPVPARIANVRGPVTVERGGLPAPATAGQSLNEGAVIATGPNAFVRLTLTDGGHVSLPSQSRVRISRLRRVVLTGAVIQNFEVLSGRAESEVAPVKATGDFSVRTPISVSAVRGTEFRVAFDPDRQRASTEVIKGVVGVVGVNTTIIAEASQGVGVGPTGARLAPLLSAPDLTSPDAQVGETVVFDVKPVAGAAFYRARLATDAGMIDALEEGQSAAGANRVVFPTVAQGAYFVRLSAVSDDGIEGLATSYAFFRARNGVGGLGAGAQGRQYLFRWEAEGEGQAQFRFELRGPDPLAPAVIDMANLTTPKLVLTGLAPGQYSWRVRIGRLVDGRLLETWSAPQPLRIGQ